MKIKFELKDELTVTNTTVKVTTWITGQVGDEDRPALEARARAITSKFLPDTKWAFSDFGYTSGGMMFRVQATTRIDSTENDQLEERAKEISDRQTALQVYNIDPAIPTHEMRAAESRLRVKLLQLALSEATGLGGEVTSVDFTDPVTVSMNRGMGGRVANATYAAQAFSADEAGGAPLGHSEKIYLAAIIEVESSSTAIEAAGEPKVAVAA